MSCYICRVTSNDQDISIVTPLYTIATDLSILRTSIHYEGANERLVSRMRVGFKAMNTMDIYIYYHVQRHRNSVLSLFNYAFSTNYIRVNFF